MNNREKAAEVIRTWQKRHKTEMDNNTDWAAQNLAGDLAEAGLLAPDLPEPDVDNGVHRVYTAVGNLDVVSVTGHVQLNRLESDGRTAVWDGKPTAARAFAHVLLAAADYSEEGNRE